MPLYFSHIKMQASTSKIVCSAVSTFKPAVHTSVRCASRTRRPGATSKSASSSKARKAAAASAAPSPNAMPFSEAIRTLQSLSVGKEYAAYELTLLSRLAASVNINSLRGRTFLPHEASNQKKKELVLVFAEGDQAEEARRNGADIVGGSELVDEVGWLYSILILCIAHVSLPAHRSCNHASRPPRSSVHQIN